MPGWVISPRDSTHGRAAILGPIDTIAAARWRRLVVALTLTQAGNSRMHDPGQDRSNLCRRLPWRLPGRVSDHHHILWNTLRAAVAAFYAVDGHFGFFAVLLPFGTLLASIVVLPSFVLVRCIVGRTAFSSLPNARGSGVVCALLSIPPATWIGIHSDFEGPQPYLPHLISAFSQSPAYIAAGLVAGCVYWIIEFAIPLRATRGQRS